ncbi:MAG: PucR family transcriptional regulator [Pseudonocardiaceae bacterium]|nr:MAG: PucR family transcriptional regulator [Pseudonocardiaceae bacterium]
MVDEDNLLRAIATRLQLRASEIVDRQLTALRRFPSYDRVPADDLERSCYRNLARVIAMLERHTELPASIVEDELASGQRRALQGVPADDVVAAYRAVLTVLRDAFIDEAELAGADDTTVLAATRRLWDLTDHFTSVLVSARQKVEIDAARRDERHRMAYLQRLLSGTIDPVELINGGAVYGVLPDQHYWVLRGRALDSDVQRLARHLEALTPRSGRSGITLVDDEVAGIAPTRPTPLVGAVVAVAGPVPLTKVAQAFVEATQVLRVAVRYGAYGVVDTSTLSVRVAVAQHPDLGEQLHKRLVEPFDDGDPSTAEDVLETVGTYLKLKRSVRATATHLSIHENTVRYRLDRYEARTGVDLSDTDSLVEVWWAFEHRAIRPRRQT